MTESAEDTRVMRIGHRILLLDDDRDYAKFMSEMLADDYFVTTMLSPIDALAAIDGGKVFDVILCDYEMPDLRGTDVHAKLLERNPNMAARIVIVTGRAQDPELRAYAEHHRIMLLKKPMAMEDVHRVIGAMIKRQSGSEPAHGV